MYVLGCKKNSDILPGYFYVRGPFDRIPKWICSLYVSYGKEEVMCLRIGFINLNTNGSLQVFICFHDKNNNYLLGSSHKTPLTNVFLFLDMQWSAKIIHIFSYLTFWFWNSILRIYRYGDADLIILQLTTLCCIWNIMYRKRRSLYKMLKQINLFDLIDYFLSSKVFQAVSSPSFRKTGPSLYNGC